MTGFEPASRLQIHGDIGPSTATVDYLLAPEGDGTSLTSTVDLEGSASPLRLVAPLANSRVKEAVAAILDALRRILET